MVLPTIPQGGLSYPMTAATTPAHRRHDISNRAWETIAPYLSGGPGKVGTPRRGQPPFHCITSFRITAASATLPGLPRARKPRYNSRNPALCRAADCAASTTPPHLAAPALYAAPRPLSRDQGARPATAVLLSIRPSSGNPPPVWPL